MVSQLTVLVKIIIYIRYILKAKSISITGYKGLHVCVYIPVHLSLCIGACMLVCLYVQCIHKCTDERMDE